MMYAPAEIEQLALNAWPSLQTYLQGGMVVRWAEGYTKRANSATVLFDSSWTADKQGWVENFYWARDQRAIFRLLSFNQPEAFDDQLAADGYDLLDLTHVMIHPLDQLSAQDSRTQVAPLAEWLDIFHRLDQTKLGAEKQRLHQAILEQIPGRLFPLILTEDGEPAACGLGVLDGGALGLFDIVTAENHRRKGLGSSLVNSLLVLGKSSGAQASFLQVTAKNGAAGRIYVKSGFKILYKYWYRAKAR